MAAGYGDSGALLLAWEVRPDLEEPWRRLLQELSETRWQEEHASVCRRLGILVEYVWFVPKRGGGGTAIICLEAADPGRTTRELLASEKLFDSWGLGDMGRFFGFEFSSDSARVTGGELLFSWRDAVPDKR